MDSIVVFILTFMAFRKEFIIMKIIKKFYLIFFYLEPVNTRAPAFPSDVGSFVVRGGMKTSLAVTCKAQGYPVPVFRYGRLNY